MIAREIRRKIVFFRLFRFIGNDHNTTRTKKSFSIDLINNPAPLPSVSSRNHRRLPARAVIREGENILTINRDSVKFNNSAV
jgi:hypothetical protein